MIPRWLTRPLLLLAVAGAVWLLPGAFPLSLELTVELPRPTCVNQLELRLMRGEQLARSLRIQVGGRAQLEEAVRLPRGDYVLRASVECANGSVQTLQNRSIRLQRSQELRLRVPHSCLCKIFNR